MHFGCDHSFPSPHEPERKRLSWGPCLYSGLCSFPPSRHPTCTQSHRGVTPRVSGCTRLFPCRAETHGAFGQVTGSDFHLILTFGFIETQGILFMETGLCGLGTAQKLNILVLKTPGGSAAPSPPPFLPRVGWLC